MITDYNKEFIKRLESIKYGMSNYELFQDFLTMASASLHNIIVKNNDIEKEYLQVAKKYKDVNPFCDLLGITIMALEQKTRDFLGEIFMFGGLGNKKGGQFFTPYHISKFMSKVIIDKEMLDKEIKEQGYFKLSEPCCGGGGMIIAASEHLLELGYNPQQIMRFQGIDIDLKCCQMTFIQTSILGLKGEVVHGNTLTLESWRCYKTPFLYLPLI